jgi:hypothetical protein
MIKKPYLSPERQDLLLWVGLCITEWAQIECLLFRLTMEVLGVGPKGGAIIYKSTTQIKARITLINELVKAVLDETDPIIEGKHKSGLHHSWDSIYKNLNNHLELRNKLAHWPTATNRSGDPVLHYSSIEVYKGKLNPEAVEEIDVAKNVITLRIDRTGPAKTKGIFARIFFKNAANSLSSTRTRTK